MNRNVEETGKFQRVNLLDTIPPLGQINHNTVLDLSQISYQERYSTVDGLSIISTTSVMPACQVKFVTNYHKM